MEIKIGRRQFISALGGAAAWPLTGPAQQPVFAGAGSLVGIASGGTAGSYPFPDALNTGVPAGTALRIYTGPSTITTNGADLSGYIFTSTLTIAANNVTIENSKFDVSGTCIQIENADLQTNQYTGTLIKNCEMAGETNGVVVGNNLAIQGANLTVLNCNIHGYAKDINCEGSNITVEGSYLWNESAGGTGAHLENIICDGVGSNFNFSNNTLVNTQDNTTTIFNATDFGSSSNVTINGNLLYGGASYTLYVGALNNVSVTNNVMARIGNYGYLTYSTPTNFTWANNTDFFTGQVILLSNRLSPNPNIVIASFTPSNSFRGDDPTFAQNIATAASITLKGCTLAGNSVSIYDGATLLGTTTANARTGVWTFHAPQTGMLAPGLHSFTAKDTTANKTSAVFNVTIPS